MRAMAAFMVGSSMLSASAFAQTPVEQQRRDGPPSSIELESPGAVPDKPDPSKLTPGANSFAEGQARALVESKGFTNVSALVNDKKGFWRGSAKRGDEKVEVSVDFQGKVAVTPEFGAKGGVTGAEVKR